MVIFIDHIVIKYWWKVINEYGDGSLSGRETNNRNNGQISQSKSLDPCFPGRKIDLDPQIEDQPLLGL